MPQGQIQWNSGRWARILSDGLCHTVQKRSIVLIDGGDDGGPFEWLKDIWVELMCTSMDDGRVRYKTASKLFCSWGTCRTLENSTALPLFPSKVGWNTTDPTPAE